MELNIWLLRLTNVRFLGKKSLKNAIFRHKIGLQPNEYAREQLLIS